MRRWLLLTVLCMACDSSSEPAITPYMMDLGRYAFSATVEDFDREFSGTLVITASRATRIEGRWEVPGFSSELTGNSWNEDAYLAWAEGTNGASYNHRIVKTPAGYTCEGRYPYQGPFGQVISSAITCTLEYLGP